MLVIRHWNVQKIIKTFVGIVALDCSIALILFLLPIKMQCVFATLRDNLLSSSHVVSDFKSSLTILLMVEVEFED